MKSAHAYLKILQAKRQCLVQSMAEHEITDAACEVFDELIWRTQMVTDHIPEDAPLSRTLIAKAVDAYDILLPVMKTATQLDDLLVEGLEAIGHRRDPFVRVIARVESAGFIVAEQFDAVTDTTTWPDPEPTDPAAQVALEAEKIARAEQAMAYHERVQRIRELITPLPDIIEPY